MALHKVFDKETGEFITGIKYDSNADNFRKIECQKMNTIFNFCENGNIEIVYHKRPFDVPKHVVMDEDIILDSFTCEDLKFVTNQKRFHISELYGNLEDENTNNRNFKNIAGCASAVRPDVTVQDLLKTIYRGGKRAKQNFYNYALSNEWEYFCTYTFEDLQARTDLSVLQDTWHSFTKSIKRKFPDLKIIAVPEKFKKGGYHLHSLMANLDLNLIPKRNNETKQFLFTDYGHPRMQATDWKNGWNEVVMINPDSSQLQVVNYLTKYFTKSFDMPYGSKRYYITSNLNCRTKYIENYNELQLNAQCISMGLTEYKDNDSFTVYRNF